MLTVRLADNWARAARHLAELGLDTPEGIELLRNKGAARTAGKRDMLVEVEARARAAGFGPLPAHPGRDPR